MSNEPIEPEDIVSDGVDEAGKPVPRDDGSADGAATTPPGTGDTNKVPGPAEEQDEETADDRGLTTDTSPD
ncbi:MAG: hypothetical protein NTU93_08580 [Arthrobacter sp.]|nr:hypothetical protein [Arthrobacter sp.]